MSGQERVMSSVLERTAEKMAPWFPGSKVLLWNGQEEDAVYLWVSGMKDAGTHNRMENLKVIKEDDAGEFEVQVPMPRMVNLFLSVVPAFPDTREALDASARIIRNFTDDPFVPVEEFNWYGNESARTMVEAAGAAEPLPLPLPLQPYDPFRWDCKITLGINSEREEKITRVKKRQFTAVKK